jgi:hypothetical protein
MRKFYSAALAATTALAAVSFTGAAQARDDHRGDGPRYSEHRDGKWDRGHRRHRHGPNVSIGFGDGYYEDGVWIGIGDSRHRRHHRHYD